LPLEGDARGVLRVERLVVGEVELEPAPRVLGVAPQELEHDAFRDGIRVGHGASGGATGGDDGALRTDAATPRAELTGPDAAGHAVRRPLAPPASPPALRAVGWGGERRRR